jgi:hypothetical protein
MLPLSFADFREQTHGSLIYALMHIDFLHLYPVSP